jgi:hypothetical protein
MEFSKARPMQHIDRRDLYTSLETRVEYLHSFLDFSSRTSLTLSLTIAASNQHEALGTQLADRPCTGDIEALQSGAKYIRALIPAVVNIVYKKLLQYDITARAFETRSTSYEGPIDARLDENSPQIQHRKLFLRGYLTKLCSDPSQMEFWSYLDKVGMMHVGRGRAHPLHVEYIHVGATLAFVQDVLVEAILEHPRLAMHRKIALVKALGKVVWIQNDLFAKWYVRDGEEYQEDRLVPEVEAEGWLHGKKVLGGDGASESDDVGACPFKNLAMSTHDGVGEARLDGAPDSGSGESRSGKVREVGPGLASPSTCPASGIVDVEAA